MKSILLFPFLLAGLAASEPTVYFIRHGEKNKHENGLSSKGVQRAECLRSVFGEGSGYDIGHIMAQTPKPSGRRSRPYKTVRPVADDLGLEVDLSCQRDDVDCVADAVWGYQGEGNILISWEHKRLTDLVEALGVTDAPTYPDDAYDLIWTLPPDYANITDISSESCPVIDGGERPGLARQRKGRRRKGDLSGAEL